MTFQCIMIALRNKTLDHTFFHRSKTIWPSLSRKIVDIHKSCYHGKLTLHFSSLLRSGYESPTLNKGNCRHIFNPLETLQNMIYSFLNSHFHCVWWRSVEAGERFYGVLRTDRKLSFYCFLKLLVLFCLTFSAKSISLVAETPAPRLLKLGYK